MNPTKPKRYRGGAGSRSKPGKNRRNSGHTQRRHKTNSNKNRSRNSGGFRKSRNSSKNGRKGGGRKMATFDPSQFINKNPTNKTEDVFTPVHSFADFGLNKTLLGTIEKMGIKTPSPIQDQVIGEVMAGKDVVGLAETGTGKTAAFLIPLIEQTIEDARKETLILAPTRELAIQIQDELKKLSRDFRIFSVTCVGGINIHPQIRALKRKNHFIVGTPGRIIDLLKRNSLNPKNISAIVLDEADRMLDMGFIHDMRSILSAVPKERQTLFFSATMAKEAEKLVGEFLESPVTVSVKKKDTTDSIEQDIVEFDYHSKFEKLLEILSDDSFKRVIIFGAMKHSVERLARELSDNGIKAESIHGNKSHNQRQRSLAKFKSGNARVLVATDVAARGIHVDNVSHVINYDLPNTFEDYVHRIGRTGRAKEKGQALTFVQKKNNRRY